MKKQIAIAMAAFTLLGAMGGCQKAGKADTADIDFTAPLTGEITVGSYDSMRYGAHMEAAAKKFMEKYPGTVVNISTFSSMPEMQVINSEDGSMVTAMVVATDNTSAEADYLQALNTSLMSGGGADVLAIDVLPYYKYAEAGQLLDMSALMDADPAFSRDDYYANVFDAMRYNGGQYILPLDFTFNYLTYDKGLLSDPQKDALAGKALLTYDDLLSIGAMDFTPREDLSVLSETKAALFQNLFAANLSSFINLADKTCDFTSGAFETLLADTVRYDEAGYLFPTPELMNGGNDAFITSGAVAAIRLGATGGSTYFSSNMSLMLMNHFNTSEDGGEMAFTIGGANTDNHEIAGLLANNEGKAEVNYMQAFGINANTKNARLAWEFIKFLLSEDEQLSIHIIGTPVHRAAAAEDVKQEITMLSRFSGFAGSVSMSGGGSVTIAGDFGADSGDTGTGGSAPGFSVGGPIRFDGGEDAPLVRAVLDEKQTDVFNRYMAQLNTFLADLRTHTVEDTSLTAIVQTEADRFFAGEISANDAARNAQSKISLILSEQ